MGYSLDEFYLMLYFLFSLLGCINWLSFCKGWLSSIYTMVASLEINNEKHLYLGLGFDAFYICYYSFNLCFHLSIRETWVPYLQLVFWDPILSTTPGIRVSQVPVDRCTCYHHWFHIYLRGQINQNAGISWARGAVNMVLIASIITQKKGLLSWQQIL